eukprot:4280057-Amphidinium_carterae.1
MRTMSVLLVNANRFAGTLPNRAVAGLGALSVSNNHFEGKMSQTQCCTSKRQKANLPELQGESRHVT